MHLLSVCTAFDETLMIDDSELASAAIQSIYRLNLFNMMQASHQMFEGVEMC